MAEQWTALAREATVALIQASEQPLGPSFSPASVALQFRTGQIGRLNRGTVVPWQDFNLVGPTTMLWQASRAIARYNELHNRVVRVFSIYGGTIGVLTDGPLWQTNLAAGPQAANQLWQMWIQRRAVALDSTHQASLSLRAVAAYDLATVDAFTVARSFPENSASRNAWMRAAENLALRADAEAHEAAQSETTMYNAVSGLYLVGLEIFLH